MRKIAIYPGTFDPMTNGHIDIIQRAAKIFEHVIIAIAENPNKKPLLSVEKRIELGEEIFKTTPNISIQGFSGLLITFAQKNHAQLIIRGLRAVADFEYEFQLARMNKDLAPELETIFMTPNEKYAFVSSTLVREIAKLDGDVGKFVPPCVVNALTHVFKA
ncbi:MAG: pantetheine-phosphate adenylyltransferase [Legionellales bacterium]|nr:pantetheine-phosphate adenylyltransferase [Legionellales bacterium]